ncbi:uncharacterized protein LOC131957986 [Physella acuta]|uniref:uncharacterized protein LOC131957986 n=1 Tax=Physella acuta TaxID=109671 RepID=UPI0027DDAA51|nr:uncharacterized protein LOC131957986 [Physella acuta]
MLPAVAIETNLPSGRLSSLKNDATKFHERQTEYLRLQIVDMVGQHTSSIPGINIDGNRRQPRYKSRLAGYLNEDNKSMLGPGQRGTSKINLDLVDRQPAETTGTSSKVKATAWLIRRFRRRRDAADDGASTIADIKQEKLPKVLYKAEDSTFVNSESKQAKDGQRPLTSNKQDEKETKKNFKNDYKYDLKNMYSNGRKFVLEKLNKLKASGDIIPLSYTNSEEVTNARPEKNGSDAKLTQEEKALNAKNTKKLGVFSASLEAFKQRLKSRSYTLQHPENDEKERDLSTPTKKSEVSGNKFYPRPPSQPQASQNVQHLSGTKTPQVTHNGRVLPQPKTPSFNGEESFSNPNNHVIHKNNSFSNANKVGPMSKIEEEKYEKRNNYRMFSNGEGVSNNKLANSTSLQNDHQEVHTKQAVLAPLTVHNLRLHESLQYVYERRQKRMEVYLKRQQENRNGVRSHSGSSGAGDRMWKWLAQVEVESDGQVVEHGGNTTTETVLDSTGHGQVLVDALCA